MPNKPSFIVGLLCPSSQDNSKPQFPLTTRPNVEGTKFLVVCPVLGIRSTTRPNDVLARKADSKRAPACAVYVCVSVYYECI